MFRPERDKTAGGSRKLHNEELHNLFALPNIIRIIKSKRMTWTGHVARMGRIILRIGYWWENQKERDFKEVLNLGGRIVLEWILKTYGAIVWTCLICLGLIVGH
jgi:hypothetical protein